MKVGPPAIWPKIKRGNPKEEPKYCCRALLQKGLEMKIALKFQYFQKAEDFFSLKVNYTGIAHLMSFFLLNFTDTWEKETVIHPHKLSSTFPHMKQWEVITLFCYLDVSLKVVIKRNVHPAGE